VSVPVGVWWVVTVTSREPGHANVPY
jgi:hypothetical protein